MKSKKNYSHLGSHAIQIVKWTTMSFACLMTFSFGIFLGRQFSDSNRQPAGHALMELNSEHPVVNTKIEQSEDTKLTPETEDHTLKNTRLIASGDTLENTTKITTSSQAKFQQSPSSEESQETQSKENSNQPAQTNKKSKDLSSQLNNNKEKIRNLSKQITITESQNERLGSSKSIQKESLSYDLPSKVTETLSAKYTIQLGIYDQEEKAKFYVKQLRDQGLNAFYMSFSKENKSWYRVSSGVYSDKTLATNDINHILKITSFQEAAVKEIL